MSSNPEVLEMRFKRFLHYGSELPLYKSGDRFHQNCYTLEHVPSLLKLCNEYEPQRIVDIITNVKKNETSMWPDSIIFALAVCIQQPNVQLQNTAYKAVRLVCSTAKDIILFVKFYKLLKIHYGLKTGGGNGFKRAVAQWYLVWMPFDLADILLYQRGYHGWKHSDVLKLAHVKPVSPEQQVLFTYTLRGLKETQERYSENANEQVRELLEYIATVEGFRHVKNHTTAAKALAVELHNIERVPSHLLKHQEVWNELIPNMDVKTLMNNIQRLSILGFLKYNNTTVMKVVDVLNNVYKAEQYKEHPTRVFIEILIYEKAAKYCLDIASKMNHPISKITPARKPPKVNQVIRSALVKFFYSLFKFQKPTGKRFLVAVDVRPKMFRDRCHHCLHLSPIDAARAICLSLIRSEPEGAVTIATYNDVKGEVLPVVVSKEDDLESYESLFNSRLLTPGPACVASAIHWAEVKKQPVDVFVVLSNFMVATNGSRAAINQYRQAMDLPNSRVITCSLTGNIKSHKDVEGNGMLCVVGFDEHICPLIQAVARGAF